MANELSYNANLSFNKNGVVDGMNKSGASVTVAGDRFVRTVQVIGTSEEALKLAELGSLGYAMFENLDATNYVELLTATSGVAFCRIEPGKTAGPFRFGSGITAPYAIANTASVKLAFMIVEP